MIVNLKTAKVLSITLKRRPLLHRAAIEQLTNYDYPDVRLWRTKRTCRSPHRMSAKRLTSPYLLKWEKANVDNDEQQLPVHRKQGLWPG